MQADSETKRGKRSLSFLLIFALMLGGGLVLTLTAADLSAEEPMTLGTLATVVVEAHDHVFLHLHELHHHIHDHFEAHFGSGHHDSTDPAAEDVDAQDVGAEKGEEGEAAPGEKGVDL